MSNKPTSSDELRARISQATADLQAAERELDVAITEIQSGDRADKRIISEVLQAAFDKVVRARANLVDVISGLP